MKIFTFMKKLFKGFEELGVFNYFLFAILLMMLYPLRYIHGEGRAMAIILVLLIFAMVLSSIAMIGGDHK